MKKQWIIYMYVFPNNKKYIGATCQTLAGRQGKNWKRYEKDSLLWSAIQEFGTDNIEQVILKRCDTVEEAEKSERAYIQEYKTADTEFGYNKHFGGEGLRKYNISEERKEQLREQMKELGAKNKGKIVSSETRLKQRNAKLGRKTGPRSEEIKAKIGRANSRENMSPETRMRRKLSKQKPVIATEKDTGEILHFQSALDAAEYFGVRESSVSRWIKGTRKPSNNYTFKYSTPTTTE